MQVFELKYPGGLLDFPHQDEEKVKSFLIGLEHCLTEIAIVLHLFEEEQLKNPSPVSAPSIDRVNKRFISESREEKRIRWADGAWPAIYAYTRQFIYAKSFLYSADTFGKILDKLSKVPEVPPEVIKQKDAFREHFKDLIGVRNTSHHMEDRLIQEAYGRPIPVTTGEYHLHTLDGNNFKCTKADGNLGAIEISKESAEFIQDCLQKIINSFNWQGFERYYPS